MIMNVPFLDVRATYLELKDEIDSAVARVLNSGSYILGDEVAAFEGEFAAMCGTQHCVGVANGLDALHLALKVLGVGPGDEVIVPSNTYIATWLAVSQCGAVPVPVEPSSETFNIDPDRFVAAITRRTKVILPVHLYGAPADLSPILGIANQYGLRVVEDAAQAHGARYKGSRIGGHGDIVTWSFYPGKNLGAFGDAGALTTNDPDIADRLLVLRNYGSRTKYVNEVQGCNSRLDPIQAAMLRVKLRHLDIWNDRRRSIANIYLSELADAPICLPAISPSSDPVWHLFVIKTSNRDALQQRLTSSGIDTLIHYPTPPHLQAAYVNLGFNAGSFPLAEQLHQQVLSLPMGPHLTQEQASCVVQAVKQALS